MSSAPDIIQIPNVGCQNCGAELAWRGGVGRYVISHAYGDDVCSRATARISDADREVAARAYRKADEEFALKTAIERVRALHVAETGVWTLCRECTNGEEVVLWPCPTIQTLDATITITQEDE